MKTILLPTDFSSNSRNAIEYALKLYQKEKVKFILLNAYQVPHAGAQVLVSIDDIMRKDANAMLRKLDEEVKEKIGNESFEFSLETVYGDVVSAVNRIVSTQKIDAIVMGTKGASGIKEAIIGSNTASVIKNVKVPVIAVPENAKFTSLKQIALAADYSSFNNKNVLAPLMDFIEQYESKLYIVNVVEKKELVEVDEAVKSDLHNRLHNVPHTFYYAYDVNLEQGVSDFIKEHDVDLLVMVHHDRSFFQRIFHSSATSKMAMHTKVPFLALDDR